MKRTLILALALMMVALSAAAASTDLTYPSRGVEVPATLVIPDMRARDDDGYPLVIMMHGHGGSRQENIGFDAIAQAMAAKGIASIRMDFPGCGDSEESFQLNTLTNMKQDVRAALAFVRANYPAIDWDELGLLGYSMGGRMALELLVEGLDAEAVALLAPAADTNDLTRLFGGPEDWADLRATAQADGYVVFTTIYGQVQELSKAWFDDLYVYGDDLPKLAARAFDDDAIVLYGQDDEAVDPAVSQGVADALRARVISTTGDGHGFGFYSGNQEILNTVCNGISRFFAAELID